MAVTYKQQIHGAQHETYVQPRMKAKSNRTLFATVSSPTQLRKPSIFTAYGDKLD
jgi:hypothetical protein